MTRHRSLDRMTKEQRLDRWKICAMYLRMTSHLSDAIARAKQDGLSFNASIWLTATGKMIEGKL